MWSPQLRRSNCTGSISELDQHSSMCDGKSGSGHGYRHPRTVGECGRVGQHASSGYQVNTSNLVPQTRRGQISTMDTGLRDPFDLTEVRAIIAAYLTQSDAIACSRVCKAWSIYFRGLVWHTVDFDIADYSELTLQAVVNYGHHIRAVKSLQSSSEINLMWNQRRLNLTSLSVVLSAELSYQTDLNDFLRLVRGTLTELDMTVKLSKTRINVPVDVILPREPSRLTKISLRGLQLSQLSLIELLQGCPSLHDLSLCNVLIPSRRLFTERTYQHPNLRHLSSLFRDIVPIPSNLGSPRTPDLLSLFPGLKRWTNWGNDSIEERNFRYANDTIRRLCPNLNQVQLDMENVAVREFVAHVFTQIETLIFMCEALSSEMIVAILKHSKTLKHIECLSHTGTLLYNFSNPPRVTRAELSNAVWIILSIPRLCPHLESFCFPLHEIDMDDIESDEWECKGLKELRIRIVGLNTAEQIDQAIGFWLEGRRALRRGDAEKQDRSPLLTDTDPFDLWVLGSRVADHLLKFKELHTVWLGTTVWRV
ncbi:hypothetical protein KVV02_008290 [Mortierella alpina]|uniref:F-box domain-containing protein n=1 Tax=Mortierella alpina TaxID=64518 RepID=A0A9P7ZZD2_MORAP|nr:hypothetical protein KVV02_008290 [Mortierella alpina]